MSHRSGGTKRCLLNRSTIIRGSTRNRLAKLALHREAWANSLFIIRYLKLSTRSYRRPIQSSRLELQHQAIKSTKLIATIRHSSRRNSSVPFIKTSTWMLMWWATTKLRCTVSSLWRALPSPKISRFLQVATIRLLRQIITIPEHNSKYTTSNLQLSIIYSSLSYSWTHPMSSLRPPSTPTLWSLTITKASSSQRL